MCRKIRRKSSLHSVLAAAASFRHGQAMKPLVLGFVLLEACHAATVPSVRQPDGSWHVQCGNSLQLCVQKANDLCDDRGYVVLGGTNKRSLYGAELGQSQVEVREADLSFACADRRGELPKVLVSRTLSVAPPPRVAEPEPAAQAKPASACTPGATQRCVGAGACDGGQSCSADGAGFGPCDCGNAAHAATHTP
jgi:hypothetical protein